MEWTQCSNGVSIQVCGIAFGEKVQAHNAVMGGGLWVHGVAVEGQGRCTVEVTLSGCGGGILGCLAQAGVGGGRVWLCSPWDMQPSAAWKMDSPNLDEIAILLVLWKQNPQI